MTHKAKNIFLIGPMGAGKSHIGKFLAKKLNMDFYDSDEEIIQRSGVDIAWIFDLEGEEGFRKRESIVLAELVTKSNMVLATGGGIVLAPENRALLAANGVVVYLEVSVAEQLKRMIHDKKRPLLRVPNREEKLQEMLQFRAPLYEEIADLRIATDGGTVQTVTKKILDLLKRK